MTAPATLAAQGQGQKALQLLKAVAPKGGRADVAVALLVVSVVFAMLLPMPELLLDALIAVNICTAAFLIVLVLQINGTASLSTFPSLLLLTTLFRVALSIASTRLILLEGSAGHIIEAFGEVVVGGNLVVGLVVFVILTLVQFLVITKGAERVAEVGARFTLDSLPGKQMAIDMELKAGYLTAAQARTKRGELAQESQFFGAMDGAMKFVKGDAIAGILIVLINLLGGLGIGIVQRGMSAGEAVHVYSILSIGDGLVAQIPALLMSLTAGMLVTRVASGDDEQRNIGKELAQQLTGHPKAMITASLAMLAFAMLPGMPTAVFGALAAGSAACGLFLIRKRLRTEGEDSANEAAEVPELREFIPVRPLMVLLGPQVTQATGQRFLDLARTVRNRLVASHGLVIPPVMEQRAETSTGWDLAFCSDEVRMFGLRAREDLCTFAVTPGMPAPTAVATGHVEQSATGQGLRVWASAAQARELAPPPQGHGIQTFWEYAETCLTEALWSAGPKYFSFSQAQLLLKIITERSPELGKELERSVPAGRLCDVLRRLLQERVSIRNLAVLSESLVEWGQRERDAAVLCECVRGALSREICDAYTVDDEVQVLLLHADAEGTVRDAIRQTSYGDFLSLDQRTVDGLIDEFSLALASVADRQHVVVLCAQDVRAQVRKLIATHLPELPVLAVSEVPSGIAVKVLRVVGMPKDPADEADLMDEEYSGVTA